MTKSEVVVVGAGGHAKVCIENLQSSGFEVAYCVANASAPDACLGIRVLQGDDHLRELRDQGFRKVFVAIGNNFLRARLAEDILNMGYTLVNAISAYAIVSPSVTLGNGIAIMPGAVINAETNVGDLAIVNTGATVDHDCIIGRAAHVGPQCGLAGNVVVGKHCFLGVGVKAIPGVRIGSAATIGAGAVVVNDIDPEVTAVGIPARPSTLSA
ncbi:MAG: acetyltransferase [Hyphomicrobium sp.]|uniref:acetyltransferase n=1 Tax=Hyphomicrobium sp. TaxID=82 RepID=UPI0039E46A4E